ncbi:MAG: alpha/beta family hydrolase [Ilumatobacteraceae bacterium]
MIRGVVLFPGAGSSANHASLLAIEGALHPLLVERADFPYRIAGRRAPDRAPVLVRAVRDAVRVACEKWSCAPSDIVIGGRSMGGRMCSMAVAGFDGNEKVTQPVDAALRVAGLVCVSYPLHPPTQPTKLRIAHLSGIDVPTLFVSGTRDEFGSPDELREHLAVVPNGPRLEFIDGARHDLRGKNEVVARIVAAWVASLSNTANTAHRAELGDTARE